MSDAQTAVHERVTWQHALSGRFSVRRSLRHVVGSDTTPADFQLQARWWQRALSGLTDVPDEHLFSLISSGTALAEDQIDTQIAAAIRRIFERAADEVFESGKDSNLSLAISAMFRRFPGEALEGLATQLELRPRPTLVAEVLNTLGAIKQPATEEGRLSLLAGYLAHPSALIRDAASTGLSFLGNPAALPSLREAIGRERNPRLREDMEAVARDLERNGDRAP